MVEDLRNRARVTANGEVTPGHAHSGGCEIWRADLAGQGKATSTSNAYDDALKLHVLPGLCELRVREVTVGAADRFSTSVRDKAGPGAARHAKTVLNQVMRLAARHDAVDHNPLREVAPAPSPKKPARIGETLAVSWRRWIWRRARWKCAERSCGSGAWG